MWRGQKDNEMAEEPQIFQPTSPLSLVISSCPTCKQTRLQLTQAELPSRDPGDHKAETHCPYCILPSFLSLRIVSGHRTPLSCRVTYFTAKITGTLSFGAHFISALHIVHSKSFLLLVNMVKLPFWALHERTYLIFASSTMSCPEIC